MARKFTIRIHENGDVSYSYWRDKPFQNYLIEWPFEQIVIIEEDKIQIEGYEKRITSEGYMRLSWSMPHIHNFTYKKIAKAKGLRFEEVFRTKQDNEGYWFWLTLDSSLVIDLQRSLIDWDRYNLFDMSIYQIKPAKMSLISISDYGFELVFHKDSNLVLSLCLNQSKRIESRR